MAADEAVLNIVGKKNKKSPQKIFFLKYVSLNLIWQPSTIWKALL
jgi:hypothetical protein